MSKTNNANLVYLWNFCNEQKCMRRMRDKIRKNSPDYITQLSIQNMLLHAENKHVNGMLSFFMSSPEWNVVEHIFSLFFFSFSLILLWPFRSGIFILLCHLFQFNSKQTPVSYRLFIRIFFSPFHWLAMHIDCLVVYCLFTRTFFCYRRQYDWYQLVNIRKKEIFNCSRL